MKKIISVFTLLIAINFVGAGQELQEYIGTADRSEVILDTKGLPDGGAVMVGYSTLLDPANNYDYTQSDILIIRVDNQGGVVWNRRFGVDTLEDFLKSVIIADNGDFVAVGYVAHMPWMLTSTISSFAAIFRFDPNTGATIDQNFISVLSGGENDKGAIYDCVTQLDNGNFVAVGARDAQPGAADGIVTYFNGTSGSNFPVIWNRTLNLGGTDGLTAVTNLGNRIFVGGNHNGATFDDLNLAEFNLAGIALWSKSYDYTFTFPPSTTMTNNVVEEMKVVNNELMILTGSANDYAFSVATMAGIMRTDLAGNFISLRPFYDQTSIFSLLTSVDYENAMSAYFVINPGNTGPMNLHAPGPGPLVLNDAMLAIVDPTNGGVNDSRSLSHMGTQSLLSVNLSGIGAYYGGSAVNDPAQIGALDVFYVKSENGLFHENTDCRVEVPQVSEDDISVTENHLPIAPTTPHNTHIINLDEFHENLEVVLLCIEEPCEVEDLTFCGSLANPLTFTFDVITNPPGLNVVWDFGDGTGPHPSTAGTPLMHPYASPGAYTVCVDILNAAGNVCTTVCIDICVPDIAAAKPGKSDSPQTKESVLVREESTVVGELYPNPADGYLHIPVSTQLSSDNINIRIIRMDGVVVHDTKTRIENGKQIIKVEMNNIVPGNYMCEIRNGDTRSVKVFTKK